MSGEYFAGLARRIWYGGGTSTADRVLAAVLLPPEGAFRAWWFVGEGLRRLGLARPKGPSLPIISVGNLTVGGSGKSTLCLELAARLAGMGRRPAVVSHSYGRVEGGGEPLAFGGGAGPAPGWRRVGDEAAMMAAADPGLIVVGGADKARSLYLAAAAGAGVVIIDDAFHRRDIRRDLDIVLVDARGRFGNGHCLPRGPLREPLRALARADVFVVAGEEGVPPDLAALLRRRYPRAPIMAARKVPVGLEPVGGGRPAGLEALRGASVYAFCGLGNPESFTGSLASAGALLAGTCFLRDHHPYGGEDMSRLGREAASSGAAFAVTTAKDAVKIDAWPSGAPPLFALRVRLQLDDQSGWLEARLRLLAGERP